MDIRDKLMLSAARVYAEAGYRGATTRRIAQDAGVNEITLFRHFGSKDALILEAIRHCGPRSGGPTLPEVAADPQRELVEWCRARFARLYEVRSLIRTCMGEVAERPDMRHPATAGALRSAGELSGYLARLRDQGLTTTAFDVSAATWMLMAVLFSGAMWCDVIPEITGEDTEGTLDENVRVFLRGIGVTPGAAARDGTSTDGTSTSERVMA
ncbi:MAG: TetR/AcrR family transcriptional regulator [Gemmatimonadaceae bacterium]